MKRIGKLSLGFAALFLAASQTSVAQTIAITGGKVFPVSGAPIENGTVLISGGKIVAVGANVTVPSGAQRIDATGKWVTPGLVNGNTQLGLSEVGAVQGTNDASARGRDEIAAAFRVWEGLNTTSALFAPARREGVTSVMVMPQGGLIWGQAAVIKLVPGMLSDMLIKGPVAMIAQIGSPNRGGAGSRGELIMRLRELFEDTRAFQRNRAAYERAETRNYAASRKDLEAMIPVIDGLLPLVIATDKSSDIDAALMLAREYGIKIIIGGGSEAWMVADKLAAARVPVMTGAMNNIPGDFASLGTRQDNLALLRRAGVPVIIIGNSGNGDEQTFNVRNIRQEAGNAVSYGMSWDDALRAVTLAPAEIFGVAGRVGSLAAGRDADVVVWSGDPFEFSTRAEHVFVAGREYLELNRQELLTERYKTLPPRGRR
ncbi:MAG: amidohydrolase family protein [Gemmatimonadaceae bacterium]|nr:amidohydrolase family protein [Gemmatimonadaceae bacterium]